MKIQNTIIDTLINVILVNMSIKKLRIRTDAKFTALGNKQLPNNKYISN